MGKSKNNAGNEADEEGKLDRILQKIADMDKSLNFLSDKFDEFKKDLEQLHKDRKEDLKERRAMLSTLKDQQETIDMLKNEIEYLLIRDKANCAEVKGIPFSEAEDTDAICRVIANKVGCKLEKTDLVETFRIKSKIPNLQLIKIKFKDELRRNEFVSACKKARLKLSDINKGGQEQFYVNEELPWMIRKMFTKALAFKRNQGYKFCWVQKGRIFLRREADSQAIQIRNAEDLEKLRE